MVRKKIMWRNIVYRGYSCEILRGGGGDGRGISYRGKLYYYIKLVVSRV